MNTHCPETDLPVFGSADTRCWRVKSRRRSHPQSRIQLCIEPMTFPAVYIIAFLALATLGMSLAGFGESGRDSESADSWTINRESLVLEES